MPRWLPGGVDWLLGIKLSQCELAMATAIYIVAIELNNVATTTAVATRFSMEVKKKTFVPARRL